MENVKWKIPIRMCVVCKKRFFQNELNRFQCINQRLVSFSGKGRSFYICNDCLKDKKFIKFISKKCNISKEKAREQIFHFTFSSVN